MKKRELKLFSKELTPEQQEKRKKIEMCFRAISCVVFLLAMIGIGYLVFPIFSGVGQKG